VFDWLTKLGALVGLPSVIIYLMYYRRRIKNQAVLQEGRIPIQIKSSSVTQLESELAALAATFETDRRLKGETIDWLTGQLENDRQLLAQERLASAAKDQRITELSDTVRELQSRVVDLVDDLGALERKLQEFHDEK